MNRKIRIGMVGGGKGAFIGSVHRIALRLDGYYELVAGSFSSDFENSKETGKCSFNSNTKSFTCAYCKNFCRKRDTYYL